MGRLLKTVIIQLTVQFGGDVINDALLCVAVLNGRVIVCHKVALKPDIF